MNLMHYVSAQPCVAYSSHTTRVFASSFFFFFLDLTKQKLKDSRQPVTHIPFARPVASDDTFDSHHPLLGNALDPHVSVCLFQRELKRLRSFYPVSFNISLKIRKCSHPFPLFALPLLYFMNPPKKCRAEILFKKNNFQGVCMSGSSASHFR